jgi:hypothetical protein
MEDYERGRRQVPLASDSDTDYTRARTEFERAQTDLRGAQGRFKAAERTLRAIGDQLTAPLEKLLSERRQLDEHAVPADLHG